MQLAKLSHRSDVPISLSSSALNVGSVSALLQQFAKLQVIGISHAGMAGRHQVSGLGVNLVISARLCLQCFWVQCYRRSILNSQLKRVADR